MHTFLSARSRFTWQFIAAIIGFAIVFYFQYFQHIHPCPLCILQRAGLMGVGLMGLLGLLFGPKKIGRIILTLLALLFSIFGFVIATRQFWLQLHPGQATGCGPGLNYLVQTLPPSQVIKAVFQGSGDCAVIHWQFLGLTIAGWSAVLFAALIIWNLITLFIKPR